MTSSPCTYVPTAATALARTLRPVLNAARARVGLPPAPFVQVDRIGTSAGDYGTLSAQARDRRMAANGPRGGRRPALALLRRSPAALLVGLMLRPQADRLRRSSSISATLVHAGRALLAQENRS
jgi:hypothetical protein